MQIMAAPLSHYLDPGTLATIGSLSLRARMIVEGHMTGMHRSPMQGVSVEFAQHRQYSPGDDIRHLDWKIFARTDKLHLKQYQQETNLDLLLMVDVTGSMAYSSGQVEKAAGLPGEARWRKFDHAASLAAAMAHVALNQQDRVGLMLVSNQARMASRMSSTHDHWRGIVEALSKAAPVAHGLDAAAVAQRATGASAGDDPPTDFARVFDQVIAKLTRRSILVLVSDLFDDPDSLVRAMARLHHRGHELILLQTLDPAELAFPFRGPSEFIGLEGEGRLPLDPQAMRKSYLEALARHQQTIEQAARRFKFDHLVLDTSQSLGPPLSHFLARRTAMITQGH